MSNENLNVEIKEEKCLCHSKWFKKFMTITLGSFLGVFLALSLFAALHKPPMLPTICPCGCSMMNSGMHHHHHFDRAPRGEFHKKMIRDGYERKAPVRVEIED